MIPYDERTWRAALAAAAKARCVECRRNVPLVDNGMHHREASGFENGCDAYDILKIPLPAPAAAGETRDAKRDRLADMVDDVLGPLGVHVDRDKMCAVSPVVGHDPNGEPYTQADIATLAAELRRDIGHDRPDGTRCTYLAETHCRKCGWSAAPSETATVAAACATCGGLPLVNGEPCRACGRGRHDPTKCATCGGRGQVPLADVMSECDDCGGTGRARGRGGP